MCHLPLTGLQRELESNSNTTHAGHARPMHLGKTPGAWPVVQQPLGCVSYKLCLEGWLSLPSPNPEALEGDKTAPRDNLS